MPATRTRTKRRPERGPRRLSREARYAQLVDAALPLAAAQGLEALALDDVAQAAGVTRNLLYHYFPRGRQDLALAVAERAGRELTGGWILDPSLPAAERLAANNARMIEHALEPTPAWRIYRLAVGSTDPEIREALDRFTGVVIAGMSLNHLGTAEPPPLARVALQGYLAFFGAALDEAREAGVPPERLLPVLHEALTGALRGATG
jgi:AcrR family transcriptional regulator